MKICIDPGHGGRDPGAVGPNGLLEKDIVLLVALRLKHLLKERSEVVLTRSGDEYVSLGERVRIANIAQADLFVSVHCNSAEINTAHGVETFHHPTSRKGIELAEAIQPELIHYSGLVDRGVKYANFQVLRETIMPAVLVELAFINNPSEEVLLGDRVFRAKCAVAIAAGIRSYEEGQNGQ